MKRTFSEYSIPLATLFLLLLGFGLMIPKLGLYWDDWPPVATSLLQGNNNFWAYFEGERPISAWIYTVTLPILGTKPIVWHIFALLLRWLSVLGMWWILRFLWPKRGREIAWMVLIFTIFPVFLEQPVAVTFTMHWTLFALYFLSVGLMLQAVRSRRWFWPLTILALLAQALNTLSMEYFWGLELLRPFLLWIAYGDRNLSRKQRLKASLTGWLPYLLVLIASVSVRFFFMLPGQDPHRPSMVFDALRQPFVVLVKLVQVAVQDLVANLAGAWYNTFLPAEMNLLDRVYLASLAVALVVGGLVFYYLRRLRDEPFGSNQERTNWLRQAFLIGLLGALFGALPAWLTDRTVISGMYSSRFAFAAMFGLSILSVAILEWFTPKELPKIILVSALIGLAAGFHLRNATTYYRSTVRQNQFYWQLYWRAPYIKPGTAILSNDELFPYVGRASTALALNLTYPQPAGSDQMAYWFFELPHDIGPLQVPKLARGKTISDKFRTFSFTGQSTDSLVIYNKSGTGRCLWVLSPDDGDIAGLPELTIAALPVSNLSRIEPHTISADYPPRDYFGKEPVHDWCYYFQKADLARQLGDWQTVADLGDEAKAKGYTAQDANEWLPFIEGYARIGRWDIALELSKTAFIQDGEIAPRLCRLWGSLNYSSEQDEINQLLDDLQCN